MNEQLQILHEYGFRVKISNYPASEGWTVEIRWPCQYENSLWHLQGHGQDGDIESAFVDALTELKAEKALFEDEHGVDIPWPLLEFVNGEEEAPA